MKRIPSDFPVIFLESPITEASLKMSYDNKWALYKLSKEDFLKIALKQGNRCASCGVDAGENTHLLCVDHDHATNEIRGLLCHDCNTAAGWLYDDPVNAENLAHYLRNNGTGIFIPETGA